MTHEGVGRTEPLRLRLSNDYDMVVAGLRTMLEPFADRVRVIEVDVDDTAVRRADLTLFDTFGRSRGDQREIEDLVADPTAGAVVVYSWNTHPDLVARALVSGCAGYLDKALSAEALVEALQRIGSGATVVTSRGPVEAEADRSERTWPGQREGLSEREAEVVALISEGYTNPEIAARMYITGNSLKTYIRSAYRKMGVERRAQAVRWGIGHGMIAPGRPPGDS